MKLQYSCFLGLILGSCMPNNTTPSASKAIRPVPRAVVENLEPDPTLPCFKWKCESADSAQYTHLKATFYQGQDGEIYEKSYDATQGDKCCYSGATYEKRLGSSFDTVRPSFKKVLDLKTYVELEPSIYSKDQHHVYGRVSNLEGGFRYQIEKAHAATFRCLDSTLWWGVDNQHVFYRGDLVKGLKVPHLKTLKPVLSKESLPYAVTIYAKPSYVKNLHQVYYETDPIPNADAPSFKVVDSSTFDALDKYRKYSRGHPLN